MSAPGSVIFNSLCTPTIFFFFFLNDPATTEIYPLPLPAPLPIYSGLTTTTSRSASARRLGTQRLAGHAACARSLSPPALTRTPRAGPQYRRAPSHVPRGSRRPGSRRLHAGHHLASRRAPARLIPGAQEPHGFDAT